MYTIVETTQPDSEIITVAELKNHLTLNNGTAEDTFLQECITAARTTWENRSGHVLHVHTFRQYCECLEHDKLWVHRSPVVSIDAVKYYNESDVLTSFGTYYTDTAGIPACLYIPVIPTFSIYRNNVIYVDFHAGYSEGEVPKEIKLAVRNLAGEYYKCRGLMEEKNKYPVPLGFERILQRWWSGVQGTWGN